LKRVSTINNILLGLIVVAAALLTLLSKPACLPYFVYSWRFLTN